MQDRLPVASLERELDTNIIVLSVTSLMSLANVLVVVSDLISIMFQYLDSRFEGRLEECFCIVYVACVPTHEDTTVAVRQICLITVQTRLEREKHDYVRVEQSASHAYKRGVDINYYEEHGHHYSKPYGAVEKRNSQYRSGRNYIRPPDLLRHVSRSITPRHGELISEKPNGIGKSVHRPDFTVMKGSGCIVCSYPFRN